MKVKVEEPKQTNAVIEYPVLAKSVRGRSFLVLFTAKSVGVLVDNKSQPQQVGKFSDTWTDVTNANVWEILPVGTTVTLEQT